MQMMSRKYRGTFSEPERVSKAGLLVRGGRIIAMASVLAVAPMVTGFPLVSSPAGASGQEPASPRGLRHVVRGLDAGRQERHRFSVEHARSG